MERMLSRARRHTCSALQLAQADLVEAVAAADPARLRALRDRTARRSFGLVAQTADAALAQLTGHPPPTPVVFAPQLPLAGIY
jgi:hypothetical protein